MRLLVTEILINELQLLNPKFPPAPTFSTKEQLLIDELISGKI